MTLKLLAIDVGNTRTHLGLFTGDELLTHGGFASRTPIQPDEACRAILEGLDDEACAVCIASVNEAVLEALLSGPLQPHDERVVLVERDVAIPIGRQLDPETIIGHDRLLNAAAAYDLLKQACIVVDAGSAVTVDFVDGEGTFHGGAILPGVRMMLGAMHNATAQLPEVSFAPPDEPIGHNTTQAMRSGVFHGVRGAVRELIEKYAETYRAYPKVIATGGDAAALFDGYELIETIMPDLTLRGLAVTFRRAAESDG